MTRAIFVLLTVAAIGGAYFYFHYDVEVQRTEQGLESIQIVPRGGSNPSKPAPTSDSSPAASQRPTIRIATFNAHRLDDRKLANRRVGDVLVRLIPRFDIVAVQDIRAANQGVLIRLVDQINAAGHHFDFAVADNAERSEVEPYSAFVFNRSAVEVDRTKVQAVEDPAGRFRYAPLCSQFRTRGPDPAEAFTFKLVNVHVDADRPSMEIDLLDDVYRAVRTADPHEDDVILLGDFGVEAPAPGPLAGMLDVVPAVADVPTTLAGIRYPVDNLWFDRRATTEFVGRAEVFDVMRAFELTRRETEEISAHLPVWAEFSTYEGGQSGLVDGITVAIPPH